MGLQMITKLNEKDISIIQPARGVIAYTVGNAWFMANYDRIIYLDGEFEVNVSKILTYGEMKNEQK